MIPHWPSLFCALPACLYTHMGDSWQSSPSHVLRFWHTDGLSLLKSWCHRLCFINKNKPQVAHNYRLKLSGTNLADYLFLLCHWFLPQGFQLGVLWKNLRNTFLCVKTTSNNFSPGNLSRFLCSAGQIDFRFETFQGRSVVLCFVPRNVWWQITHFSMPVFFICRTPFKR